MWSATLFTGVEAWSTTSGVGVSVGWSTMGCGGNSVILGHAGSGVSIVLSGAA